MPWVILFLSLVSALLPRRRVSSFLRSRIPRIRASHIECVLLIVPWCIAAASVINIVQQGREHAELRKLTEQDVYRPLSETRRKKLISELQAWRETYTVLQPSITVWYGPNNPNRQSVAEEFVRLFQDANIPTEISSVGHVGTKILPMKAYGPAPIMHNPDDKPLAESFAGIIEQILGVAARNIKVTNVRRGGLVLMLQGVPRFSRDGIITLS